jgi:hypothetical protein
MAITDRRYCTAITADTGANHKSHTKLNILHPIFDQNGNRVFCFCRKFRKIFCNNIDIIFAL